MVVSMLLAVALASTASDPLALFPCTYGSRLDNEPFTHPDCGWKDRSGVIHVTPAQLRRLDYDENGLAVVFIDRFYYVRPDGRLAPTMVIDNWAEPFHGGRARSQVNGKIGFIDHSLRLRVQARYDGAYTFDHGFAVVCLGCVSRTDGEHSWYEGGAWGCVDRFGHEQSGFRALKPGEAFDAICLKGR